MKVGDVYVHKTTGAYAVVTDIAPLHGTVKVRMSESTEKGSTYVSYDFIPEELETVEGHLKRNLNEMELKQELLDGARKRQEKKELEEKQKEFETAVPPSSAVN